MRKWNARRVLWFALILASTTRAQTGVNNAALKGDYAFSFTGMTTGDGTSSTPFAAVGRFTADGAGSLSNGELTPTALAPWKRRWRNRSAEPIRSARITEA